MIIWSSATQTSFLVHSTRSGEGKKRSLSQRKTGEKIPSLPCSFRSHAVRLPVPYQAVPRLTWLVQLHFAHSFAGLPRLRLLRSPAASFPSAVLLWIGQLSQLMFALSRLSFYIPEARVFLPPILV